MSVRLQTKTRLGRWVLALWVLGAGVWGVWWYLQRDEARPLRVFNWHGYRAGLDERGGSGAAVGLEDLVAAGVTHVGVPQDHSGDFGSRHYIAEIQARGIGIVRTVERRWNAGLGQDLGRIILDWHSAAAPGAFFVEYLAHLHAPCHGIGWNLEHDVLNEAHYPLTAADRELAAHWGLAVENHASPAYVGFRCRQLALIFQMYYTVARRKYPQCRLAIGYSGYAGARYRRLDLEAAYGCDWQLLGQAQSWRGQRLEPITHAMCAWHQTVDLPPTAWPPLHTLPVLHTLQLAPALATEENFRLRLRLVTARLRPGDGLGTVEHGRRPVWDEGDRLVQRLLGEVGFNIK